MKQSKWVTTLTALTAVATFSAGSAIAQTSAPAGAAKPGAHAHAARSAGKRQAPLALRYELLGKPVLGEPLLVDLYLTPTRSVGEVQIQVGSDPSLLLKNADASRVLRSRMDAQGWYQRIELTPMAQGLNYVHVSALADVQGVAQGAAFAVPVQIGEQTRQKVNGQLSRDSNGQAIVSMKARETVSD